MAAKPQQIRHIMLTPSDFLDDDDYRDWDARLCGAYFNIILWLYTNKGWMALDETSAEDIDKLRRRAQWHGEDWETSWCLIRKKFQIKRGRIRHKRVSIELRRAQEAQQAKHNAGVKGAKTRWQGHSGGNGRGNAEGKGKKGREQNIFRVTWNGSQFDVPETVMGEFCERWPSVTREAIEQEIADCAAYHAERKSKVKSPRGRIVTWLKNAFDKYQQATSQVRKGQDIKKVLGLDGDGHGSSPATT